MFSSMATTTTPAPASTGLGTGVRIGTLLGPILLLVSRGWRPPGDLVRILNGGDLTDPWETSEPVTALVALLPQGTPWWVPLIAAPAMGWAFAYGVTSRPEARPLWLRVPAVAASVAALVAIWFWPYFADPEPSLDRYADELGYLTDRTVTIDGDTMTIIDDDGTQRTWTIDLAEPAVGGADTVDPQGPEYTSRDDWNIDGTVELTITPTN